jgi:hypothetical protein
MAGKKGRGGKKGCSGRPPGLPTKVIRVPVDFPQTGKIQCVLDMIPRIEEAVKKSQGKDDRKKYPRYDELFKLLTELAPLLEGYKNN